MKLFTQIRVATVDAHEWRSRFLRAVPSMGHGFLDMLPGCLRAVAWGLDQAIDIIGIHIAHWGPSNLLQGSMKTSKPLSLVLHAYLHAVQSIAY